MRERRTNRRFSAEFKAAAVQRVREVQQQGGTAASVARELDVDSGLLSVWMNAATPEAVAPAGETLAEEVCRLRREVETLRMERDFAKKAAVDPKGQRNTPVDPVLEAPHGKDRPSVHARHRHPASRPASREPHRPTTRGRGPPSGVWPCC